MSHTDPYQALGDANPLTDKLLLLYRSVHSQVPQIDRLAIALYDQGSDWVKTFFAMEEGANPLANYQARLQNTRWLKQIAETQQPRLINDFVVLESTRKRHVQALIDAGYCSSYTLPMTVNGHFFGFVFFNSKTVNAFTENILIHLDTIAHLASLVIFNERANIRTLIATMKSAVDLTHSRDPETANHLERMSRYARLIAMELARKKGFDDSYVEHIYLFAPLHDLGKIATPDNVLLKAGPLNEEQLRIMRQHPTAGLEMIDHLLENYGLSGIGYINMLRNIVHYHHEALDGSGYPEGLAGDDIPIEARIVTVADVFDALTSARPYKPAWSNEDAFEWLRKMADIKFDRDCVEALGRRQHEVRDLQQRFAENAYG